MRMICRCDACGKEGTMLTPNRLENGWEKWEGSDLCKECYKIWRQEYKAVLRKFFKDRLECSKKGKK